jgi:hypothetical protein
MYCNISSSSTATSQKHLLQRPKNLIATFENHLLQHLKKTHCNTGETEKKNVQNCPWPITSSSPEGGRNRTPELTGTLATAASLISKGGGEGGLKLWRI